LINKPTKGRETEMARAATTEVDETEVDYTKYADKPATDLQTRFHEWILDKTEIDPNTYKNKSLAFFEGVRLGVALRIPFQASPENQEALAQIRKDVEDRKAERAANGGRKAKAAAEEDDAEEETRPAKKAAKAAKAAPAKRARAAAADEEEAEETPAPARRRAPAKRGRAAAAANEEEAPF
jgi:hypothetical protein